MRFTAKLLVARTFSKEEKELMAKVLQGDMGAFLKLYKDKIIKRRKGTKFTTPCWEWAGRGSNDGYGELKFQGKKQSVHRVVWQLVHGPIPVGTDGKSMEVDHLCRNPACFNPDHLQLITSTENKQLIKIRRDEDKAKAQALLEAQKGDEAAA